MTILQKTQTASAWAELQVIDTIIDFFNGWKDSNEYRQLKADFGQAEAYVKTTAATLKVVTADIEQTTLGTSSGKPYQVSKRLSTTPSSRLKPLSLRLMPKLSRLRTSTRNFLTR